MNPDTKSTIRVIVAASLFTIIGIATILLFNYNG